MLVLNEAEVIYYFPETFSPGFRIILLWKCY